MAKKIQDNYKYDGDLFSNMDNNAIVEEIKNDVINTLSIRKEEIIDYLVQTIKDTISNPQTEQVKELTNEIGKLSNSFSSMLTSKVLKAKIPLNELENITGKEFSDKVKNVSESARLLKNDFTDKETRQKASTVLSEQKKNIGKYKIEIDH